MELDPFLWLVLCAYIYVYVYLSLSLYIYIFITFPVIMIFFSGMSCWDIGEGLWSPFMNLRPLRPLSFLSTPIATQASAAVVHSYLPYFQEFFLYHSYSAVFESNDSKSPSKLGEFKPNQVELQ